MTGEEKTERDELYDQSLDLNRDGRHEEALACIELAIEKHPRDWACWSAKAQFLYHLKQYEEAIAAAVRSTDLEKRNYHAWGVQGMANAKLGDFEAAAACYRKSLGLRRDAAVMTLLAAVEVEFDVDRAIKHASMALELEPDWDEAQTILDKARGKKKSEEYIRELMRR